MSRPSKQISINDQEVSEHETTQTLKELIANLVRNSWNAASFMEDKKKTDRRHGLRVLWADKRLTNFDPVKGPEVDFT